MTDKEKEFIKNVNIDKARNKIKVTITLTIISLLTYVVPFIFGDFDFGLIFEIITLVSIFIAKSYMSKYDEIRSKRFIIIAMIPIGWLLIYDLISIFAYVSNVWDLAILGIDYYLGEILTILNIMVLYMINKDLAKADNPIKYKESTDWFYERYETKENEVNRNDR